MEGLYHIRCPQCMLGTYRVRFHRPLIKQHVLKTRTHRYAFFPETANLSLEDVDHLFEKGGITGGVWGAPGGRTVTAHSDRIAGPGAIQAKIDEEKAARAQPEIEHVERQSGSLSDVADKR